MVNRFQTVGTSGLQRYSGYVDEPYLDSLRGGDGRKTLRQMEYGDPVVGAVLFSIEFYLRQMERTVEPGDETPAAQEQADFVASCFDDMSVSWEDTLSEILTFLVYGWSYHEIVYKLRQGYSDDPTKRSRHNDGRIGWRKLPLRSQLTLDSWVFDEDGGVQAMVQTAPPHYNRVEIPIEKSLLFRTTAKYGNPEGRSILLNAYRPWYFKRQIEQIEAIGIERDLAGLPIAWVPTELMRQDAGAEEQALLTTIKQIVTNIRRDEQEGVVMPRAYDTNGNLKYDLSLLSTGGQRQFNTDAIIARYDQRIAMTVLADWILLGHERVGTQALSVSKLGIFTQALQAWADSIADIFNAHAIPRLLRLNGLDDSAPPRLRFVSVPKVDLEALGQYITAIAGAGALLFPDQELENHLRRAAGLPDAPEAEEEFEPTTAPPAVEDDEVEPEAGDTGQAGV